MRDSYRSTIGAWQNKSAPKEVGFTLVEVLVSVLVLSLGILGLIALESLALKNNNSAYQRSQATLLAYDLTDRIRANVDGLDAYKYAPGDPAPASHAGCSGGCTPTDLAESDLSEWLARLKAVLPDAQPSVAVSPSKPRQVDIAITWVDYREREDASEKDVIFETTFRP